MVQVLILYLGASWVIIEVAGELQDALQLPAWVTPVAILLLLVGLVVVLATAWVQSHPLVDAREAAGEVPDSWEVGIGDLIGAVRRGQVPHLTWGRALLGGAVALSLLFGLAGAYVLVNQRESANDRVVAADDGAAPGLAIVPFAINGIDADVYREGLVTLMSTTLDGAAGLRAVDSRTVLARWDEVAQGDERPDLAAILGVASGVGARWVLVGSAVGTGSDVRLVGELYDASTSSKLGTARAEGPADSLMSVVDALSFETARILLTEGESGADIQHLASVTTSSLEALVAYIEGERLYRRGEFDAALEAYDRAIARDSSFALAHLRAYESFGWTDSGDPEGLAHLDAARRSAERLPAREQALVQALVGVSEGDPEAFESAREATARYPDDPDLWNALGELHVHVGRRAVLPFEDRQEPLTRAAELAPDFAPYLIHLTEFYLVTGDTTAAAELIEREELLAPDMGYTERHRLAYDLAYSGTPPPRSELAAADPRLFPSIMGLRFLDAREAFLEALQDRFAGQALEADVRRGLLHTLMQEGRLEEALRANPPDNGVRIFAYTQGLFDADSLRALDWSADTASHTVAAAILRDWDAYDRLRPAMVRFFEGQAADAPKRTAARLRALPEFIDAIAAGKKEGPEAGIAAMEPLLVRIPESALDAALWWLATMHEEAGDEANALRYYRASAHIDPFSALHAARLADRLGKPDLARRYYQDVLIAWDGADPEFQPWIEEARGWLERLPG